MIRATLNCVSLPHYQVFKELFQQKKTSVLREWSLKTKQNAWNSVKIQKLIFLHRKEVIHPHLPVGIPCYDFTPVTGPTLIGPLLCRLGYHLRVLPTPMAWRAVCTTPGNVFTPTFWFGITSDSSFMKSSCRLQSVLRLALEICSTSRFCVLLYQPL